TPAAGAETVAHNAVINNPQAATLQWLLSLAVRLSTTASQSLPIGKLWLKALPLSLIAIAGLLLTGYLLQQYAPLFQPLPLVFVFLSLITLPHMSSMHQLHKRLLT
ncbi:MAG: hypothetical protein EOO61_17870, partial [Hymenobacter sp.]